MLRKLILIVLLLLPVVLQIAGPGNSPRDLVDVATICSACESWQRTVFYSGWHALRKLFTYDLFSI